MTPRVSVIIPVHNRAATIGRSINSVLTQTATDYEIIVVDDGSTDDTREIVRAIPDARIRLICHQQNSGAAAARNTGMQAALGYYIAWLDSDDEWLPDKLKIQLDALQQASPDEKASYTGVKRIEKNIGVRDYIPRHPDHKQLFMGCDLGPGSTLMFERSLLDTVGFLDTSFKRYEDWDWLLRYSSSFRLLAVDIPLAIVYYDASGRSAKNLEGSAITFVKKYSEYLRQFGRFRNKVIGKRWMEVAAYFAREHAIGKVLQYVLRAVGTYPFQPVDLWAGLVNAWFGVKIGRLFSKTRSRV